jgi:hypothetical protein
VFAQQGYFVLMINPTGSTTFGQGKPPGHGFNRCFVGSNTNIGFLELTDAIAEDWGGKPFVDLQKGWKYALAKYPEACRRTMKFALI